VSFVSGGDAADASVHGEEDGIERVIKLVDNPDSFGYWEFDDLAAEMTFEPENFSSSKFMATLLELAEKHKDFLKVKAK